MKKNLIFLILLISFLGVSPISVESQERLKEEVKVTAVEIPVHVYHNGSAVKNLTKDDFEIYENGEKQVITGFEIISRTIGSIQNESKADLRERLFILIFNIFDCNKAVEEGIDYFFQNIFKPGDQLLVVTENRVLNIEEATSQNIALSLKNSLKNYKIISMQNTLQTFRKLEYQAERLMDVLQDLVSGTMSPGQALLRYFENYERTWLEFRRKYIIPDVDQYQNILKRVMRAKRERWAICFQQREIFPRLKYGSQLDNKIDDWIRSQIDPQGQVWARLVQTRQMELKMLLEVAEDFPKENLQNLFTEANMPFYLILLKSSRHVSSEDFELMAVSQEFEDCLRRISLSTGGTSFHLISPSEALERISEHENFYYLLVYSPDESSTEKERNIEVKVKGKGLDIVYPKFRIESEKPPIAISNFKFKNNTIEFTISHFERRRFEKKLMGIADVKIDLFDKNSKIVFSAPKTLELIEEKVRVSLNLGRLERGKYFLIISVTDKISNASDVFSTEIEL